MKMNAELLKEYNAFKKKSLATPSVESTKKKEAQDARGSQGSKARAPKRKLPAQLLQQSKKQAQSSTFNYKTANVVRSKTRFSILASIVDLMRMRYQERKLDPLTLDEILDVTNNTDIAHGVKEWLSEEALKNNKKLSCKDGKFAFKPKYPLRDRKSLLKLLERHESNGMGGILLDDIREGLANADAVVKSISDRILFVTKSNDKKAVLFHYDPQYALQVDDEIQKHWRGVTVEGLGEAGIERYLEGAGITVMTGVVPSKELGGRRKKASNRKKQFKKLNTHLSGDVLKDYS